METATVYLGAVFLLVRKQNRPLRSMVVAYALVGAILIGVGFSRVYLGDHSFFQIWMGWCFASLALTTYD
jgi:membrane-associated phospholipid phosphatase